MTAFLRAAATAVALILTVPTLAQAQAPASAPYSVDKTTIGALWANPTTKAILLKDLPTIGDYLDQIKDMTLAQVAPMSQGQIDDAKLKAIQADFDKAK